MRENVAGKQDCACSGTSFFETFDPRALGSRRRREYHTVLAMIDIFCRDKHGGSRAGAGLCGECRELRDYAIKRLSRCVFAEGKPTCRKCPVHCYKPDMRARIAAVMRHAGPRMLLAHPCQALRHLLDGFAKTPRRPTRIGA